MTSFKICPFYIDNLTKKWKSDMSSNFHSYVKMCQTTSIRLSFSSKMCHHRITESHIFSSDQPRPDALSEGSPPLQLSESRANAPTFGLGHAKVVRAECDDEHDREAQQPRHFGLLADRGAHRRPRGDM